MKSRMDWQLGTVRWFDESTGRGIVSGDDGTEYKVHYSAIESKAKWKSLPQNSKVKFQKLDDPDYRIVSVVKEMTK